MQEVVHGTEVTTNINGYYCAKEEKENRNTFVNTGYSMFYSLCRKGK